MNPTIFVVDDDNDIAESLAHITQSIGYTVRVFTDPLIALDEAMDDPPDVMIIDQMMPNLLGTEFIRTLRENRVFAPIILCTGFPSIQLKGAADMLNVAFSEKPVNAQSLIKILRSTHVVQKAN